jgi:glycosyltransferase involved in cell wall biosynthesis
MEPRERLLSLLFERVRTKSDINEHLELLYRTVAGTGAQTIVELGVRGGNSTLALLAGAIETGGHVVSVDHGKGAEYADEPPTWDVLQETSAMIRDKLGLHSYWTLVVRDDLELAEEFSDEIDLLMIDTSHSYEQTKSELESWGRKVANGGLIVIHDTVSFPEQNLAIWEFLDSYPLSGYIEHKNCNGLGIIIKIMHSPTGTERPRDPDAHLTIMQERVGVMQEGLLNLRLRLSQRETALEEYEAEVVKLQMKVATRKIAYENALAMRNQALGMQVHFAIEARPTIDYQRNLDDAYQMWLARNAITPGKLDTLDREITSLKVLPKISIIMPVDNIGGQWLRKAIDSVLGQIYPRWELCVVDDAPDDRDLGCILAEYAAKDRRINVKYLQKHEGIAAASNEALAVASGEFAGFLSCHDELAPDACLEVVKVINSSPEIDYIYSDEDRLDEDGRHVSVFFKPDWSPDLLLSMNYVSHFSVVRMKLLHEFGGFRRGFEGSQDYDLILRVTEKTQRIHHVPKPLYSWRKVVGSAVYDVEANTCAHDAGKRAIVDALRRRGVEAVVEDGFSPHSTRYRVRYKVQGSPLVSILVPTKNRIDLLARCLESIRRSTYPNYEVIVIDHQSEDETTQSYLRGLRGSVVVTYQGEFNYSRMNNLGVSFARGDHLLFLNNDTEVMSSGWLEAMLEHSQRREVGVVGSKLVHPAGYILHAGDMVGVGGIASHAFYGLPNGDPGYFDLAHIIRNCSCVTAACMMVKRSTFEELKGFDERFWVDYGDVDFCLRARALGYRVVYTPYAALHHAEGVTRRTLGKTHPPDREEFVRRWHQLLRDGDPYYNPNLDRTKPWQICVT